MATVSGKDAEEGDRNRRKLDDLCDDFWIFICRSKIGQRSILKHEWYNGQWNNIAYTNIRCQAAGNEVRQRLGKKGKYEAGEVSICRLYKVFEVRGDEISIQDIKNERDVRVRVVNEKVVGRQTRCILCPWSFPSRKINRWQQATLPFTNGTKNIWWVESGYFVSLAKAREALAKYTFSRMKRQMMWCLWV